MYMITPEASQMTLDPEILAHLERRCMWYISSPSVLQRLRRNDGEVARKSCSLSKQYPAVLDPNIRQRVDDQDANPEMERVIDGN